MQSEVHIFAHIFLKTLTGELRYLLIACHYALDHYIALALIKNVKSIRKPSLFTENASILISDDFHIASQD